MAEEQKGQFLTGSLMRHVTVMTFTTAIGLMAIFAVDFVDMIFISMLGNEALAAAIGYAGTILFFTNAINIGLSIAAGSLVARSIGAEEMEHAREYATSVMVYAALTGILVPLTVLPNLGIILEALGATGEAKGLAIRYISIIMPSMMLIGIAMCAMAVLRSYGDARKPMMATLYGGAVNAILDPILIFGLDLGLDGAAIGSVMARVTMVSFALWPLIRQHKALVRPCPTRLRNDFRAVTGIAVPAVLTNVASPIGSAIMTREMAQFGTDAVAGMAVINRLITMAFAVIFALSGTIGPIIGQNYGAGKFDRVRGAYIAGIQFTAIYVAVASLMLYILRAPIGTIFAAEGLTLELIYLFCGPLALATFFNAMIFISNASFNNLGHPVYSTWLNWGRHTLGTWPFAVLGAAYYGAPGVLYGQALGGAVFALIAWIVTEKAMASLKAPSTAEAKMPHRKLHTILGLRRL